MYGFVVIVMLLYLPLLLLFLILVVFLVVNRVLMTVSCIGRDSLVMDTTKIIIQKAKEAKIPLILDGV